MNIIVLGAGGLGSVVGALLSKDHDVLLIGRKAHVDTINQKGLAIEKTFEGNYKVTAAEKITDIPEKTLIILATKITANKALMEEIRPLLKKDTTILCLQNGLDNEVELRKLVSCHVVRSMTTMGTIFLEPGKVTCTNVGQIFLEPVDQAKEITEMLTKAGIPSEATPDIKQRLWKKLIANCCMNTLTALFQVKNGELRKSPEMLLPIIEECCLVAKAEGIDFDPKAILEAVLKVLSDSAENKSSMFQDMLKGRKTEIDHLNGKVVELGKKHGIACPINEFLVKAVHFRETR